MLVVGLLLSLSLSMYNGELDHGGGGGGVGGSAAGSCGGGGSGGSGRQVLVKAAGNKSVDGRMTACDDEIRRRTITQQPTNKGISKSGR